MSFYKDFLEQLTSILFVWVHDNANFFFETSENLTSRLHVLPEVGGFFEIVIWLLCILYTILQQFFTTQPLACDPSSLPKYPPSKEIDAKLRDEESRRYYCKLMVVHFKNQRMCCSFYDNWCLSLAYIFFINCLNVDI